MKAVPLSPRDLLQATLERQGLRQRAARLEPPAAVERFGPLHASDHHTPYLALLARVERFSFADLDRAWLLERQLDRRASMRGTLHLVPAARVADIVCSFGPSGPTNERALRGAAIRPTEARRLGRVVESLLATHGPLDLAGLKRALPLDLRARATEKTPIGRSVLAVVVGGLTDAGVLAVTAESASRGNEPTSGWTRTPQTYERFASTFGPLLACRRSEADVRLARWYFEAHGPASFEDWAWWTGLPAARSAAAFHRIRPGLVEVAVAGWPERMFVPPGDRAPVTPAAGPDGPFVRLLPYEDAALKAYRATRRRFFAPGVAERQHTLYGEVLPTVLVDGMVVGTWSSGVGGWAAALGAAAGRPRRGLGVELFVPIDRLAQDRLDGELERLRVAIAPFSPEG